MANSAKIPKTEHIWQKTIGLTGLIIAVQVFIDLIMGGEAEYFNAFATLTKLTQWLHGYAPHAPMLHNQQELGNLALPLATTVLVGVPFFVALILVRISQSFSRLFPGLHIYTEINIDARPEDVYTVLADLAGYPAWNPYHVVVEGEASIDAILTVHIEKPNGVKTKVRPRMLRMETGRELTWGGGIRGIFYGEHVFLLEETSTGGTHLIHKEDFTGVVVKFVPLDAIEEGYNLMNEALKSWVESQ